MRGLRMLLGRLVVGLMGIVALAPAQAENWARPTRVTHPGRVLDASGNPVAAAEIVFVAEDSADGFLAPDIVRVKAGKTGRFRARLWPTRPYRCWAVMPKAGMPKAGMPEQVAAGGDPASQASVNKPTALSPTAVVSAIHRRSYPSTEIRFAADARSAASEFRISTDELEAWIKHAPLRLELFVAGASVLQTDLDASGCCDLPPLPVQQLRAHVFAGGLVVHSGAVHVKRDEPATLVLPTPRRVRVLVRDVADTGIAGAVIERVVGSFSRAERPFPVHSIARRYPVATTNDKGEAEILVAAESDPFRGFDSYPLLTFVVRKSGYTEAIAGFGEKPFWSDTCLTSELDSPGVLPVGMIAREPIMGRLPSRVANPDGQVFLRGWHRVKAGKDSYYSVSDQIVMRGGEAGDTAHVPPCKTFTPHMLHVTGVVPQLPSDDAFRRAIVPRPLEIPDPTTEARFNVSLESVMPLRVQVIDRQSGPAMGVDVVCVPLWGDAPDASCLTAAETDAVGRVVLPVVPGRWLIMAKQDGDFAHEELEVAATSAVVKIRLEPLPRARIQVVTNAAEPIADATFEVSGGSWGGGGDPVAEVLNNLGYHFASWSLTRAKTDADGRAEIPFWPSRGLRINYHIRVGGERGVERRLVADEEWVQVTR